MNLRKLAKGKPCRVRIPGVCNRDPATTVLAHIKEGWCGSLKPPDVIGVHACSACHDEIDRRTMKVTTDAARLATLRALCEQLDWYTSEGILKW